MVPGRGNNETNNEWFAPLEHFLQGVVNYFEIEENLFNVGFMLYGRSPKSMSEIRPYRNRTQINTRLSLLSHQGELSWILTGRPSLPLALIEMTNMFRRAKMERPTDASVVSPMNIAVIILNGTYVGEWRSVQLASKAKQQNITIYVVIMGEIGTNIDLARKLASDDCKVYITGKTGPFSWEQIVMELGTSICTGKLFTKHL